MAEETKVCGRCGQEKVRADFYKANTKDGVRGTCKACVNEQQKAYVKANWEARQAYGKAYREVNRERLLACGKERYYRDLGESRRKHNEYAARRKAQKAAYDKEYRQRNSERKRENDRVYRANNLERIKRVAAEYRANHVEELKVKKREDYFAHRDRYRARFKDYRETHRAELKEKRKAYIEQMDRDLYLTRKRRERIAHMDRYLAGARKWKRAHPEYVAASARRRRARKLGATQGLIDYGAIKQRDKMICCICGRKVKKATELSFDHVIPLSCGGPHAQSNLRVAHRRCNSRKGIGKLPVQMVLLDL